MNEYEFKKGIKEIKNIKLTSSEKSGILRRILNKPAASPYVSWMGVWDFLFRQSKSSYVFAVLFLLVFSGSTLAYNAEKSLPGEKLYFLKVLITEPARNITNFSPEKKAEWESVKTVRRLEEALNLAAEGKLDEKNRADLEKRFNRHADAFDSSLETIATSTQKTDLVKIEFEADLSAKAKVLEDLEKKLSEREEKSKTEKSQKYKKNAGNEDGEKDKEETELKKFKDTVFEKIEKRKNLKKSSREYVKTEEKQNESRD